MKCLNTEEWYRTRDGQRVENSKFHKSTNIIVYECERDGCSDQVAYREVKVVSGPRVGEVESRERIHPDLAKEEMFVDKI